MKDKEKKSPENKIKKNYNNEEEFLEYDAPYKGDPYKEKDVIIS